MLQMMIGEWSPPQIIENNHDNIPFYSLYVMILKSETFNYIKSSKFDFYDLNEPFWIEEATKRYTAQLKDLMEAAIEAAPFALPSKFVLKSTSLSYPTKSWVI